MRAVGAAAVQERDTAGADVLELARELIQANGEHRDKPLAPQVRTENLVRAAHDHVQVAQVRRQAPKQGARLAHDQCGFETTAGNVSHHDTRATIRKRQVIVEVAAGLMRGLTPPRDFVPGEGWVGVRQQ